MRLPLALALRLARPVSIHAPREGCDTEYFMMMMVDQRAKFQFTHPGRGATWVATGQGEMLKVSIHAPREGCDRAG